jgi:polyribonucleotide nucleotidyltransferase
MLNPTNSELESSLLDMVVAGTKSAVLMVESEAKELSEDEMLGAVLFAHQEMQVAIAAIEELKAEAGKPVWEWTPAEENVSLKAALAEKFEAAVIEAYQVSDKMARYDRIGAIQAEAVEALVDEEAGVCAQSYTRWRTSHRWPRHQDCPRDRSRNRPAASRTRLGAIYSR